MPFIRQQSLCLHCTEQQTQTHYAYAGGVGEYDGDVGEYAGDVGQYGQ